MNTEDLLPPPPPPPTLPTHKPGRRLNTWVIVLIVVVGLAVLLIPVLAIVAGIALPAFAQAKERALRIQCVNNLKDIGLVVRTSTENRTNGYPKSLAELRLQITNPKVLICPSQLKGVTLDNFESALAASTYVYDGEGASEEEPNRIILLCPHHRNALVADGSIQQLSPKRFEAIEVRNGHNYLK
jgi:hypothetical protein